VESEDRLEEIIVGFMGYCSVRYSTDNELAMSDEDIKQYKDTSQAILKEFIHIDELPEEKDGCNWEEDNYAAGYNKCLTEIKKLRGGEVIANKSPVDLNGGGRCG